MSHRSEKWDPRPRGLDASVMHALPRRDGRIPRSDVEVVGFVDSTTLYLLSSDISIAPLRYGGGMKGKVGEALAHGVPVVYTTIGAEGFGFESGREVLIGDTPAARTHHRSVLHGEACTLETSPMIGIVPSAHGRRERPRVSEKLSPGLAEI